MSHLAIHAITKSYRRRKVLTGVHLDVPEGQITTICGRTGSGKTTLLRIVAGFLRPDGGTVAIGGKTMCQGHIWIPPERRRVGYVAQDGALFPHLTVAGNIGFGLPRRQRRRAVDPMLDLVGLPGEYARRYPHELSGGEQQRVALARALAAQPDVILLDEPFTSLDPGARAETRQSVIHALTAARTTTLLITHDRAEALSIADQVAVLRDGIIAQTGTPPELYQHPADPDLATYLGEAMLIAGEVSGTTAICPLGTLTLRTTPPPDGPALLMIRPEQLRLHRTLDGLPAVPARVVHIAYHGHEVLVQLTVDGSEPPTPVRARAPAGTFPEPGELVWLTVTDTVIAYPGPG